MSIPVAARFKASICGRSPTEIVGSKPTRNIDVCLILVLCVLASRGLCNELITRPEESYSLWCVVECDIETSWMSRSLPAERWCVKNKLLLFNQYANKYTYIYFFIYYIPTNCTNLLFIYEQHIKTFVLFKLIKLLLHVSVTDWPSSGRYNISLNFSY